MALDELGSIGKLNWADELDECEQVSNVGRPVCGTIGRAGSRGIDHRSLQSPGVCTLGAGLCGVSIGARIKAQTTRYLASASSRVGALGAGFAALLNTDVLSPGH